MGNCVDKVEVNIIPRDQLMRACIACGRTGAQISTESSEKCECGTADSVRMVSGVFHPMDPELRAFHRLGTWYGDVLVRVAKGESMLVFEDGVLVEKKAPASLPSLVLAMLKALVAIDRHAIERIVNHRVAIADMILGPAGDVAELANLVIGSRGSSGAPTLGPLGIINGLLGKDHYIAAKYEDGGPEKEGTLIGFESLKQIESASKKSDTKDARKL